MSYINSQPELPSVTSSEYYTGNRAGGKNDNNDKNSNWSKTTTTQTMADGNKGSINAGSSASENISLHLEAKQRDVFQNPQQVVVQLPFSPEGKFTVKPSFLQGVRKIKGVDPAKTVFTYKEVSNMHTHLILIN